MLPPNKLSDSIEELHGIKMTTTLLLRYTKINKSDPKREGGAHVTGKIYPNKLSDPKRGVRCWQNDQSIS